MERAAAAPTPSVDPDAAVVRAVVAGDVASFPVLMRRHNARVYRTARGVLGDDPELEDVVQQAWLAAYAHLGAYAFGARFSTWLTRIVVNEALQRLRKRKRAGVVFDDDVEEDLVIDPLHDEPPPSPEQSTATNETIRVVEAAIDGLTPTLRVVFMLREVDGMSTPEVAAALSLSEDAVKTRLSRAKAALRARVTADVDAATARAFSFDGARCDGIVANVMATVTAA